MSIQDLHRKQNVALSFDEFMKLDVKEAVIYDFFRVKGVADENALSRKIYEQLYPMYRRYEYAGDTMNTYRTVIKNSYNKTYGNMSRDKKDEILSIIKNHTRFKEGSFAFEYDKFFNDDESQTWRQVCNNYQLGNFCIFPAGKINLARQKHPYLDCFDRFLTELQNYYEGHESNGTRLSIEIRKCESFFDSFGSFETYLEKNYFQDYIEDGRIVQLYDGNFEEYVKKANEIIYKRGVRIFNALLVGDNS